jgi:hypothetical protein
VGGPVIYCDQLRRNVETARQPALRASTALLPAQLPITAASSSSQWRYAFLDEISEIPVALQVKFCERSGKGSDAFGYHPRSRCTHHRQ